VLQAAALMHDVGKAKGAENHQKKSYRMIRGLARPLGWSARELELAAVVARYHRGALPRPRGKIMQQLELTDRPVAMELAGVLRLANALDKRRGKGTENESTPRLEVSLQDRFVLVRTAGYSALDRSAEDVAAARHLLETVLRRPVLVRALRSSAASGKFARRAVETKS
jgi:exopolyphosphatase/guanosine-5'-triphosphate,3'-diphosphate pyrophosphatase